ncbi:MAG: SufE family protein [Alphaproteobacteria bacterium]|nr:SufE family protein [Alphaproteobacteria bacterium]
MMITDPVEKLEYVMELGNFLLPVPDKATCTEILGCTSFVQICIKNGKFYGTADSAMVRGILAIFLSMIESKTIIEIKKIDLLAEFNSLKLNFGSGRLNGIQSIVSFFNNL